MYATLQLDIPCGWPIDSYKAHVLGCSSAYATDRVVVLLTHGKQQVLGIPLKFDSLGMF